MLETIVPPLTSQCCIFRVSEELRSVNESAYRPRVISIGPFHHYKGDRLELMEKQKVRYLDYHIRNSQVGLDILLTSIKDWEESVRQSYGEYVELSSDDFVMMVLLDGLFIIEYFRRTCYPKLKSENDKVVYKPKFWDSIMNDLILLENQLPWFVLESLYNLVLPNESSRHSFLEMSCHFFHYCNKQKMEPQGPVLHFTDLIRTFHLHSSFSVIRHATYPANNETKHILSYSAKELQESGINFKATSSKCLLDIQFLANDGLFLIPQLEIHDSTEYVFRNIMALEQYLYTDEKYICDYVYLMDRLISTSEDVELLVRKGIFINNIGGHEEVAALFNNLNREIMLSTVDEYYFAKLNQDLQTYYRKAWHKWRASLKRDYFSSPWRIASVIAATVLLILTLLQTIKAF